MPAVEAVLDLGARRNLRSPRYARLTFGPVISSSPTAPGGSSSQAVFPSPCVVTLATWALIEPSGRPTRKPRSPRSDIQGGWPSAWDAG